VLITSGESTERVTTAHKAKLAYIYVRQSTAGQVRQHQESTELQYHLVDRAVTLGWPRERVAVIDDDLGKSGTSSAERHGFQRLISEIGLGKAGLVLSLDASRLARNCTISRNGPARFRVKGPTLHGSPAEPRLGSSTGPFSSRQVSWL
jgi:DNA invertase Pin-like site-specific DNA recombinase